MLVRAALRRPLQIRQRAPRRITTSAVEKETGHIEAGPDEALLFFDNVYPIQYGIFDIRYWLVKLDTGMAQRVLRNAVPKDLGVTLASVTPRIKEGGALLRVRWDRLSGLTPETVASRIEDHLAKDRQHLYFNPLRRLRSFLVRGRPWLEDLNRFPAQRLKIEFEGGPELSQETLYQHFRRYGKIVNIFPSTATQKYAILQFAQIRSATAARTCLHGFKEGSTTMKIGFERQLRAHVVREWLLSHPRFTVPAFAALVAGISVSVFEPIRTWFVEQTISRSFHYEDSRFFQWLKSGAQSLIPLRSRKTKDARGTWFERDATRHEINTWLDESASTFSVVQGPRGSGKRELVVDEVLKNRTNVFVLDCESLVEQRTDASIISNLANQLGYRPIFSWMNSLSSLVDLAAQGMMGQSTGFSETLDSQLKKILGTAASAIKSLALRPKYKSKSDARDEEYLESNPLSRPVIVIDNFLHKSETSGPIYESLAAWASTLIESNIAHVIFLTSDVSYPKILQKAVPDKLINSVTLGDASPEMALTYVLKKLSDAGLQLPPTKVEQVREKLCIIGGRLTQVDALVRRMTSGDPVDVATDAIVTQSANELIKLYLSAPAPSTAPPSSSPGWNNVQAWHVITQLHAASQSNPLLPSSSWPQSTDTPTTPTPGTTTPSCGVPYHAILLDPTFSSPPAGSPTGLESLKSLELADLILITSKNGRPSLITPGKPIYLSAITRLLSDPLLCATMEFQRLAYLKALESAALEKWEREVVELDQLDVVRSGKEVVRGVQRRREYVAGKIQACQVRLEEMESCVKALKEVLVSQE